MTKTYTVTVAINGEASYLVEADSPEKAEEIARNEREPTSLDWDWSTREYNGGYIDISEVN